MQSKMKTLKTFVIALLGLLAVTFCASAQTGGPTALPVDPSFLYTCISTPTIAAVGIALGFGGLFMVIGFIKKALSKR